MLVHHEVTFVVNTVTNTYESYISSSDIGKTIPTGCGTDYQIAYGSTSNGMAAYVNCFAAESDFGLKFTL